MHLRIDETKSKKQEHYKAQRLVLNLAKSKAKSTDYENLELLLSINRILEMNESEEEEDEPESETSVLLLVKTWPSRRWAIKTPMVSKTLATSNRQRKTPMLGSSS